MSKTLTTIVTLFVMAFAGAALAASYTSPLGNGGTHAVIFDGWQNGPAANWSTTGGFDGAGYIFSTRNDGNSAAGAYLYTIVGTDPAKSNPNFLGDLPGQWADGSGYFYVDYYVKDIDGTAGTGSPARSPGKDCLNILAYPTGSEVQWTYAFDSASGGWDHRYVQFKSDWSDAQAQAAGWYRNAGSDSFADAIADGFWMLIGSNGVAGQQSAENPTIMGLDNITISSGLIPEPATLVVLLTAALAGALIRRR